MARSRFLEPTPATLGELGRGRGLQITCAGCTRGKVLLREELLKDWGEKGRVADVVARMRCSNCARKRRRPALHVAVVTVETYRTAKEVARDKMAPIDRLVFDLQTLDVREKIG